MSGTHTLWIKVGDEVRLPAQLDEAGFARLRAVFSPEDPASPWSRALRTFGYRHPAGAAPLLRLHGGAPYFNGTALALTVSHGGVRPAPGARGEVTFRTRLSLFGFFALLRSQWRLSAFLEARPEPSDPVARIELSVAAGLAVQALLQRLPAKSEAEVAAWLAAPDTAPVAARASVRHIRELQRLRNQLSPAWQTLFADTPPTSAPVTELPAFFWDEPPAAPPTKALAARSATQRWQGIPVAPGVIEAELVFLDNHAGAPLPKVAAEACIFAFAKARPETVELFPRAIGLAFAEGGALAHACCVAREQNIPCVAGLGPAFAAACREAPGGGWRVRLDGAAGTVERVPDMELKH